MRWRHAGAHTNRVLVVGNKVEEEVDGGAVRAVAAVRRRRVTMEMNERASWRHIYVRVC
jgi:hypothetical protein